MEKRVPSLFIGKDIDRTTALTDGASMTTIVANAVEGEVFLLDEHMQLFEGTTKTISDSKTIYVAQATDETFDYTPESGSAVTGARKLIISSPIEADRVISYKGAAGASYSQQSDAWALAAITPVAGTTYILRVVYRDINEHPGQFVQTFRYVAQTGDAAADLATGIAAAVNANSGARITASVSSSTLTITGKAIPECTSSLDDIDKFSLVEFDSYFNYVDSNSNWQSAGGTKTTTEASYGSGNWEQMRDLEKVVKGYRGFTNQTTFPITSPPFYTVKNKQYGMVVIEHYVRYDAPNNQGIEYAPHVTIVAFDNGTSASTDPQDDNVFDTLDHWMGSLPVPLSQSAV